MTDSDLYARLFEENRPRLQAVAYRMLGSPAEAEDAVQEAGCGSRGRRRRVDNLGGWLTTVVARLCLDMLRARRTRRGFAGSWPPIRSLGDATSDPARRSCSPTRWARAAGRSRSSDPGRTARVRAARHVRPVVRGHRPIVGRSPVAARQLASRARRRVRGAGGSHDADIRARAPVANAFLAASRAGDLAALLAALDPGVVFRIDTGREHPLARPPIVGAEAGRE